MAQVCTGAPSAVRLLRALACAASDTWAGGWMCVRFGISPMGLSCRVAFLDVGADSLQLQVYGLEAAEGPLHRTRFTVQARWCAPTQSIERRSAQARGVAPCRFKPPASMDHSCLAILPAISATTRHTISPTRGPVEQARFRVVGRLDTRRVRPLACDLRPLGSAVLPANTSTHRHPSRNPNSICSFCAVARMTALSAVKVWAPTCLPRDGVSTDAVLARRRSCPRRRPRPGPRPANHPRAVAVTGLRMRAATIA